MGEIMVGEFLLGLVVGAMAVPLWNDICELFHKRSVADKPVEGPISVVGAQYVDWDEIEDCWNWVAIDHWDDVGKNTVRFYTGKPELGSTTSWHYDGHWFTVFRDERPEVFIGPLPPWRESLRQRPKE